MEKDNFDSLQQEMKTMAIAEVTYLESPMAHFSTNMYILINNIGDAIMNTHYSYVYRTNGVDGGELDVTGWRNTNLVQSKFVLLMNNQFAISESQIKSAFSVLIDEVNCRKEVFVFSGCAKKAVE
ncbi:hypothetical protein AVEN_135425-1 [Araneus ventricosus]|uniref:Uncharacterized protein n=1 Tax=Araneus ventricosus TaxID=182803 RepID=A0A4Y2BF92_ARAVE|nr:hypothetical protein AVEN_135425-1 [Araneus ventricosus]